MHLIQNYQHPQSCHGSGSGAAAAMHTPSGWFPLYQSISNHVKVVGVRTLKATGPNNEREYPPRVKSSRVYQTFEHSL
jgi:hypothetical protein